MDHMRQTRTNIDKHKANVSDMRNTKNAAFLVNIASPVFWSNPPGRVNPAVNVMVDSRAATTISVFRTSNKFVLCWKYAVFILGSNPFLLRFSSCNGVRWYILMSRQILSSVFYGKIDIYYPTFYLSAVNRLFSNNSTFVLSLLTAYLIITNY